MSVFCKKVCLQLTSKNVLIQFFITETVRQWIILYNSLCASVNPSMCPRLYVSTISPVYIDGMDFCKMNCLGFGVIVAEASSTRLCLRVHFPSLFYSCCFDSVRCSTALLIWHHLKCFTFYIALHMIVFRLTLTKCIQTESICLKPL